MARRKRLRVDYKELSSSQEMILDIEDLSQIPTQTSQWNNEHVAALNIEYQNAKNIVEIIQPSDLIEEDNFKKLTLKNWNRKDFLNFGDTTYKNMENHKIITIITKIKSVLLNEISTDPTRETKVDSFITSLLFFLGFDDYPFLTHPQYDYSAYLNNTEHKITSKVEFMVTKDDSYIVLIIEDKHIKNTSESDDWSEPQIAGEIFGAAFHNKSLSYAKKVTYPFNIYAIRVIGTKFTFYKSIVTREYIKETETGLPKTNKLEIKRFPLQPSVFPNQDKELAALDFTNENDRIVILSILKTLYEINK